MILQLSVDGREINISHQLNIKESNNGELKNMTEKIKRICSDKKCSQIFYCKHECENSHKSNIIDHCMCPDCAKITLRQYGETFFHDGEICFSRFEKTN